jgi:hypothetical protein
MTELSSWSELGRWTWTLARNGLPERMLRWAWKDQKILLAIHVVHFEQWPRFYVRQDREPPQLAIVGFNLFNHTPFNLSVVGVDLRVSVDSREWLTYSQRLPSEILMDAWARSGMHFAQPLTEAQTRRLREYPYDWVQIRIGGHLILKSVFGELRKEIHSDVVATIDRDEHLHART